MGAAVGVGWAAGRAVPPPAPGHPAAAPGPGSEPPSPSRQSSGRRWAAPSLAPPGDAPLSPLYLIRRPAAAASSPAPAERGVPIFPPRGSGPSRRGAGREPRCPTGLSPLTPHLGALCAEGDVGRALPVRFFPPVNLFTGVPGAPQRGEGSRAHPGGFLQPAGKSRCGGEAWPGPLPAGGRWPRHAKHHAPGHPCPHSSCHINGSMSWWRWQALHRTA